MQGNELATLHRETDSAAEAAQAHARHWAASKSDASSSGGALYYDISSGGTGASQPCVLNSLAINVFGYTKGPISETTTTAPTAGVCDGSQASLPIRSLSPIDLYDLEEGEPIGPDGEISAKARSSVAGASGIDVPPTVLPPFSPLSAKAASQAQYNALWNAHNGLVAAVDKITLHDFNTEAYTKATEKVAEGEALIEQSLDALKMKINVPIDPIQAYIQSLKLIFRGTETWWAEEAQET